jgi:hypothetical protein
MQWYRGIAFIRGINIYGRNPIDRREMLRVCRSIEDDNVRVLGLFKLDNVIFEKKGIHYASVGSRLASGKVRDLQRGEKRTGRSSNCS